MLTHLHHIIPKHMGGTDDPSNLIELTVAEHAEAHRILFEKYGMWQDEIAWKGLAGIIGHEEAVKRAQSNWLGRTHTTESKKKIAEARAGIYTIITPNKDKLSISNLKNWCEENNLIYSSVKAYMYWKRPYKGFKIERTDNVSQ
jgi:hypothetical protein